MKLLPIFAAVVLASGLTGCNTGREGEFAGTALGGAVGGLIGSQIGSGTGQLIATGAGVALGALLGNVLGSSLDQRDQAYAGQSYQTALNANPTGTTTQWVNPDSGNAGSYTPTRTFQTDNGQYCREFQQTIVVGGRTETAYGTACRQPDGSWRIVNS